MNDRGRTVVLNVDDNPAGLYAKSRVLRKAGFEVVEASNGEEALRIVSEGTAGLVLLDVKLPDISGLEVCRRIKSAPATRRLPVLHISATYATEEVQIESAESGADIYLVEPVGQEELITVVRTLLRLRTTELGLAESEERLRLATEGAGLATWEIDVRDGSAVWSARQFELLGYGPNGKATFDMWRARIHPDDQARVVEAMQRCARERAPFTCEYRVRVPGEAAERWLGSRGNVHAGDAARPMRVLGVTLDITARKVIEQERERLFALEHAARAAAEETARHKDQFLATLSHELRTPMSAVLGWLHLVRSGPLPPEQQARALETVERNARLQNELINDILDVSRIIAGQSRLDFTHVPLRAVMATAADAVRPAAEQKGVRIEVQDGMPDVTLQADASRLQQVFTNVLGNAIKFSPEGETITVSGARQADHVAISILDRGEGIEPKLLRHIFERFRQADGSITRKHGGLGLGLAIARHFLELHGASIEVASEGVGKGATFTIRLPESMIVGTAQASEAQGEADARLDAASLLQGVSALVVDDNADAAFMLAHVLRLEGAQVQTASGFEEAAKLFHAADGMDVVFSDIGMPGRDGYELVVSLRSLATTRSKPFIAVAVSGYARGEDRLRAKEAGFDLHVAKPYDVGELTRSVSALLAVQARSAGGGPVIRNDPCNREPYNS